MNLLCGCFKLLPHKVSQKELQKPERMILGMYYVFHKMFQGCVVKG